jgi:hypothetical protein
MVGLPKALAIKTLPQVMTIFTLLAQYTQHCADSRQAIFNKSFSKLREEYKQALLTKFLFKYAGNEGSM